MTFWGKIYINAANYEQLKVNHAEFVMCLHEFSSSGNEFMNDTNTSKILLFSIGDLTLHSFINWEVFKT